MNNKTRKQMSEVLKKERILIEVFGGVSNSLIRNSVVYQMARDYRLRNSDGICRFTGKKAAEVIWGGTLDELIDAYRSSVESTAARRVDSEEQIRRPRDAKHAFKKDHRWLPIGKNVYPESFPFLPENQPAKKTDDQFRTERKQPKKELPKAAFGDCEGEFTARRDDAQEM